MYISTNAVAFNLKMKNVIQCSSVNYLSSTALKDSRFFQPALPRNMQVGEEIQCINPLGKIKVDDMVDEGLPQIYCVCHVILLIFLSLLLLCFELFFFVVVFFCVYMTLTAMW